MTALAMDVRELNADEIEMVNGGGVDPLLTAAAKAVLRSPIKFAGGVGVGLTLAAVAVIAVDYALENN